MRKFSFTFVVSIICILVLGYSEYTYSDTRDEVTGPKIFGIQLGMNINEVNKILDKEGYGLYTGKRLNIDENISPSQGLILIEKITNNNYHLGNVTIDNNSNLKTMTFYRGFFNINDCTNQSFIIRFCKNYHIPLTNSNVDIIQNNTDSGILVTDIKGNCKISFFPEWVKIEKDNVVFK